uniref:Bug family tripartite tricarboxylate transporter substrate binding protein n=1 Tax=Cupriavidus necator TaxID=106590 RepID=UPI003F498FDA
MTFRLPRTPGHLLSGLSRPSGLSRLAGLLMGLLIGLAPVLTTHAGAAVDPYPNKPIQLVIPNVAGGAVDVSARALLPRMSALLGQPIVPDNRPGAGGHLGNAIAARSSPTGYTILACSGSVLLSGVYRNLTYNPIADFTPIGMFATGAFLLVVPTSSRFHTVADLVAFAKANPGKLNYASTGTGNSSHIAGEMLNMMAGVSTTHVPYKGSAPALTDVIAGQVDFLFDNRASSLPQVRAGKLRALAVTSAERMPELPNVPTVGETLHGYQMEGWIGLFAPAGTDPTIVGKLSDSLRKSLSDPAVAAKVAELVGDARYMSPTALARFMREDQARLQKVVKAANISVQ